MRELKEETGVTCRITRFLGCLEYSFEPGHSSICHKHEYNFIFEAAAEGLKQNIPLLQIESHIGLCWMPLAQLTQIDFRAEPLRTLLPQWLKATPNHTFQSVMVSTRPSTIW